MPSRRTVFIDQGLGLPQAPRSRVSLPGKEQTITMIVGLFVALWAFDSSGGDGRAFVIFSVLLVMSFLAAWYVRFPGD